MLGQFRRYWSKGATDRHEMNRNLFMQAHTAGMTGDQRDFLDVLNTPGFAPCPVTLNYTLTQMLYGCHMMQTSGILPLSAVEAVLSRGAYVDRESAPPARAWERIFGDVRYRRLPDFLTPMWHAVELANHGRSEYLIRLLQEPVSAGTLSHFLPRVQDPKLAAKISAMIEKSTRPGFRKIPGAASAANQPKRLGAGSDLVQ